MIDDRTVLNELAPVAADLVERHIANAKEWFPHEYVPWGRGRDFEPGEVWTADEAPMPDALRSALVVNLLTEDNLPHYYRLLNDIVGVDGAWGEWSRRWTAEEGRHSIVIHDYLLVTRAVDPVVLERGRMAQVCGGWDAPFHGLTEMLAYASVQELATRVSHSNTGRMMDDPTGRKVMARVAGDEALHHVFYRDAMSAVLEIHPSEGVIAIDRMVREFAMPGIGIPDFAQQARAIAKAGIYDFSSHHGSVLVPVIIEAWHLDQIEGLAGEAEEARVRCLAYVERIGKAGRRLQERRQERRSVLATAS